MTRLSFAIPVTSEERYLAAKSQPDGPSGLAGEVEIMGLGGQMDGRCTLAIPYLEFQL